MLRGKAGKNYSMAERFMLNVEKVTESGCWLWVGSLFHSDYGQFYDPRDGRSRRAHRIAYELFVGEIPEGLQLDHLCRIRCCVNPSHLEPVTQRENILRGISFAAKYAKQTHCHRGHEYTIDNLRRWDLARGGRRCKKCESINRRERKQKSKGVEHD